MSQRRQGPWPRFDSGACFAALLGGPEHGRWLIAPRDPGARVIRRYLDGSLILVTTFETADGAVELIDFMSPRNEGADLVRLIRGVRGRVELRTEFILRFDYGFSVPWIERRGDAGLRAVAGPDIAVLRTPVPLQGRDFTTNGEFTVGAGDTVPFIFVVPRLGNSLPRKPSILGSAARERQDDLGRRLYGSHFRERGIDDRGSSRPAPFKLPDSVRVRRRKIAERTLMLANDSSRREIASSMIALS
jgi:Domain of unknown function (DUF5911)